MINLLSGRLGARLKRALRLASAVLFATALYACVRPACAQVAVGTSAGGFLGFEIGAGSAGLAGANTSVASSASAQYWNPALLAGMTQSQVSLMHATWLGDLQYEWIGYARPMGSKLGVGSVSLAYFHMPSLSGVDEFDNPTGEFRVYDAALTFGLARPIGNGINAGANAKVIRQNLATVSGTGVALDLGLSARIRGTSIGATLQNLGPSISFGGGSYPLPRQIRIGASREFLANRLLIATDYNIPSTYYRDIRVGAEYRPHSMLAVRMGYRHEFGVSDDPATGLSYGLGTRVGPVSLDYAMTPDNDFSDVHRFSFGYTFGGTEEPENPQPTRPAIPRPPAPKGPPVIASAPKTAAQPSAPAPAPPAASAKPAPAAEPLAAAAPAAPSTQPAPKPAVREVYEVVLGNYQSEQSAQSELKALQILGFSTKHARVILVPGQGYRLSLARLSSRKSADELSASLSKLSFQPRVEVAHR